MSIEQDSIDRLLTLLKRQWQVENIQSMAGGMSAGMSLVSLKTPDGYRVRWVIRQLSAQTLTLRPRAVKMEYDLLKIMSLHNLPVSKPVYVDEKGKIFGSPSFVMEYLPGAVDFSMDSGTNRPNKLAMLLTQIHKIDINEIGQVQVPKLAITFSELCGEDPETPDEELNETLIRTALKRHWPPMTSNPPVLLHGDYWNGNILWNGGDISGVIDWEDAWIGEPLLDIAGTRVDLAYTFGMELAEQFTQTYAAKREIDLQNLPRWDLVAVLWLIRFINHDLASWASFYHGYGRADVTASLIKTRINEFSELALNKLEKV